MKCPRCKDHDLYQMESGGLAIDRCPQCKGVWLDSGELLEILRLSLPTLRRSLGKQLDAFRPALARVRT